MGDETLRREFYQRGGMAFLEKLQEMHGDDAMLIQTACGCNNRYNEGGCCSQGWGTIYLPLTVSFSLHNRPDADIDPHSVEYTGSWNTLDEIKEMLENSGFPCYFQLPENPDNSDHPDSED